MQIAVGYKIWHSERKNRIHNCILALFATAPNFLRKILLIIMKQYHPEGMLLMKQLVITVPVGIGSCLGLGQDRVVMPAEGI